MGQGIKIIRKDSVCAKLYDTRDNVRPVCSKAG